MRVALIDPSLFTLPYDSRLAGGLSRAGHEVVLFGRRLQGEDGALGDTALEAHFYRVAGSRVVSALPDKVRLGIKGVDHVVSMAALLRRLQAWRPGVIHFQWLPLPLFDALLIGRFRRIAPVVLTVHDTAPFNGDPRAAIQGRGFVRTLQAADRLIVHTAQGRQRLVDMGVARDSIAIVPHGLLDDAPAGPAEIAPDPMSGPITFLLFGKIKPYKGADVLIRAFSALPPLVRAGARVRIVGKPYMDLAPLEALQRELGVSVEIEPGFVPAERLDALLAAPGTVAVFPYREIEASGVLFQAISRGRPIIASRLGAFAELLTESETALLVPPDDVPALTAAMMRMLTDRALAAAMARAVAGLCGALPDWDGIAAQTEAVYAAAGAPAAIAA